MVDIKPEHTLYWKMKIVHSFTQSDQLCVGWNAQNQIFQTKVQESLTNVAQFQLFREVLTFFPGTLLSVSFPENSQLLILQKAAGLIKSWECAEAFGNQCLLHPNYWF